MIRSALPASLAQTVEHMFVVYWAVPRDAIAYEEIKCLWRNRHCVMQCFPSRFSLSKLPEGGSQPPIGHRVIRITPNRSSSGFRRAAIIALVIVRDCDLIQSMPTAWVSRAQPQSGKDVIATFARFPVEYQEGSFEAICSRRIWVERKC